MFIADTLGPYDVYRGPANVDPALKSGGKACDTLAINFVKYGQSVFIMC